ncbi:Dolichyl-phosphate-mannose-protein mannosyltransferase [Poriferisphaera corsica]|uniref:Dolichyl-phosphate-mannose-protein mannosyltransferase n=1 Tax=Poriferisphaera corsica TaxID=2528020 RepID=A0A517YWL8_9BACT|nr:glycosyltransferase family 39 protein [Poriferisphaera corsica]QDU34614.1 Dolichyl-phosphate-mannose-protein mannosyltransferase [Poriferisphaera corsica]
MRTQATTSPKLTSSSPAQSSRWLTLITLLLIILLALTIRIALTHQFVGLTSPPDAGAQPDQLDYELFAHRLATGQGYTLPNDSPTARRSPGTSLTLLPPYLIFGRSFAVARIWLSLLSSLTIIPIYFICRYAFKPKLIAFIAALALALCPAHAYYPLHFVSETPFIFFFALSLALTLAAIHNQQHNIKPTLSLHLTAGLSAGLAILSRGQLIFAYPLFSIYIVYLAYLSHRHEQSLAPILKPAATHLLALMLILAPWVIRNTIQLHKPALATNVGHTLWGANNKLLINDSIHQGSWLPTSRLSAEVSPLTGNEVQTDQQAHNNALTFIKNNPAFIAKLSIKKIAHLIIPFYTWPITENKTTALAFESTWLITLLLILIAIPALLKSPPTPLTIITLLILLSLLFTTLIFYGSPRFRDGYLPLTIPLAALGFYNLIAHLIPKRFTSHTPQ